jgi:hypothetical protein
MTSSTWRRRRRRIRITACRPIRRSWKRRRRSPPIADDYNDYLRYHLNRWVQQVTRWIPPEKWACVRHRAGRGSGSANGARGSAAGTDLCRRAGPLQQAGPDGAGARLSWLRRRGGPDLPLLAAGGADRGRGEEGTPPLREMGGGGLDHRHAGRGDRLRLHPKEINALSKLYDISEIAFDPGTRSRLATELSEQDGFNMLELRQGFVTMSEPSKDFEARVVARKIRHGGNPVLAWNVGQRGDPQGPGREHQAGQGKGQGQDRRRDRRHHGHRPGGDERGERLQRGTGFLVSVRARTVSLVSRCAACTGTRKGECALAWDSVGFWGRLRNALTRREQPTNGARSGWLPISRPGSSSRRTTPSTLRGLGLRDGDLYRARCLALERLRVQGEKRTRLPDDRLDYVLNVRPNPEMTAIALREALSMQALTWGIPTRRSCRTDRGDVAELWPLFSDRMTPRRNGGSLFYEYRTATGPRPLSARAVYHLHGPGIAGLMGDNVVAHMAKSLSLAAAQERFASTYFGNNTVIGGVLSTRSKLSQETHDKLKKDWVDKYKGPFKANKPIILEEGMSGPRSRTTRTPRSSSPRACSRSRRSAAGTKSRRTRSATCSAPRSTTSSIWDRVRPRCSDAVGASHEQEADYKLLPQRAPWRTTCLDMTWLTQGDFKTRMEGYAIARNTGVYNRERDPCERGRERHRS